jgi:hypothetical protein
LFLLQIGDRTDRVSTLSLKLARTPADTEPAQPIVTALKRIYDEPARKFQICDLFNPEGLSTIPCCCKLYYLAKAVA